MQRAYWWIAYGIVAGASLAFPTLMSLSDRAEVLRRASDRLDVTARLLEAQADAALQSGDLAVQAIAKAAAELGIGGSSSGGNVWKETVRLERTLSQVSSIWVLDAAGNVMLENWGYPPRSSGNYSHRRYYQAARDQPSELFIGEVGPGTVTGRARFTLSRAILREDGSFAGVVAAGVDSGYFENVFREMGPGVKARLLRKDGAPLAVWPQGAGEEPARADDIVAKQALTSFPLTVYVSMPASLALTEWWRQVVAYFAGGLTALLGFSVLTYLGLRTARSDEAARAELEMANTLLETRVGVRTKELKESEGRLRLAMDAGSMHAFEWTLATGAVRHVAPTDEMAFGIPTSLLGNKRQSYLELVDDSDRPALVAAASAVTPALPSYTVEYRLMAGEGVGIWVQEAARGEFDTEGRLLRIYGVLRNITAQKEHEHHLLMLLREVNHRSKNLLAVVQAIARRTAASDRNDFLDRFNERIQALSANQDLLIRNDWRGIDLEELLRTQLAHFEDLLDRRVSMTGPPIKLNATAAQTLAMAVHELVTNAIKHGALSEREGTVAIRWACDEPVSGVEGFSIAWREQGGPPVKAPSRRGFGSTVLDAMARASLGARVELQFASEGLVWSLSCPKRNVVDELERGQLRSDTNVQTPAEVHTRARVLVVEDEPLLALEIANAVRSAGRAVIGPVQSVAKALALIESEGCDAAVLDIRLADETSEPVAIRLSERGTPFLTLSAYSGGQRAAAFHGAPALTKPFRQETLRRELDRLLEKAGVPSEAAPPPDGVAQARS
jgi:two-component sensor histidine kinase/CheY-like chemotaxis protein/heme exporter protein D